MTILAILALLFGIFLASDGAFNRGLLVTILPDPGAATVALIRIAEVVTGGIVFLLLGLLLSPC
jgi:hypothetical protein